MTDNTALRAALRKLGDPLFGFAVQQVTQRGRFLPFGATLTDAGEVTMTAAAPDDAGPDADAVLRSLLDGLNQAASDPAVAAVAACEWVSIRGEGGKATAAIKVHVHHRDGAAVAFYMPAAKRLLRGWTFGEIVVEAVPGLVERW